jgi:nucleotide-binding universal stress UspA family protein
MAWQRSVLVVANVTAASDELFDALTQQAAAGSTRFTVLVPATSFGGGRDSARQTLAAALERLRAAGIEADGVVGDGDPLVAVSELWDPKRFDEIIVSTLPMSLSKWLHAGLPERIARLTDAPVSHVISAPPKPEIATAPPPPHEERAMGPLSVLTWGAHKRR